MNDNREYPAWWIYRGDGLLNDRISRLPSPPSWRRFDRDRREFAPAAPAQSQAEIDTGLSYRPDASVVELVNAAMYLRRPLLVTGRPGTGKTTLATSIAQELGLGQVLRWNVTSRTVVRDGLYQYDSMGRLVAVSGTTPRELTVSPGDYIRLGPLGTALLPTALPRVLLIDEIDKGDLDLPNDLLAIFEDGAYEVPELVRETTREEHTVMTADRGGQTATIQSGMVRCHDFPIVVMTSNDEREFPGAFLRRCIQVNLVQPGAAKLKAIVDAHLGATLASESEDLIAAFVRHETASELATDQLLNAIYLTNSADLSGLDREKLAETIMSNLSRPAE